MEITLFLQTTLRLVDNATFRDTSDAISRLSRF
ncbi:MAG: hypothetical protein ACI9YR_001776 [Bacteroidia bacterium]